MTIKENVMKDPRIPSHQVDVVEIMKKIRQSAASNRTEMSIEEKARHEAKSEFLSLVQSAQVPDTMVDQIRQSANFDHYDPRTLYSSARPGFGRLIGWIRTLLKPITKLFINLDPMAHQVHCLTVLNNFYLKTIQDLIVKTATMRVELHSLKRRTATHHTHQRHTGAAQQQQQHHHRSGGRRHHYRRENGNEGRGARASTSSRNPADEPQA